MSAIQAISRGAGADVGRRHVEPGPHEVLADQLEHVAPRDPLELADRVGLGIDPDAAFGAAERHVHQRALVGHQRRERLYLVGVHRQGVPDAALGRELVMAVLRAPRVDHLDRAVVALDGEAGVEEVLAGLDVGEERRVVMGEAGRAIEAALTWSRNLVPTDMGRSPVTAEEEGALILSRWNGRSARGPRRS